MHTVFFPNHSGLRYGEESDRTLERRRSLSPLAMSAKTLLAPFPSLKQ